MSAPTLSTTVRVRRGLCAVLAATAAGGAVALALPSSPATAATDPCAASSIAKTVGTVATNTGIYLDSHPQTNQALTTISQQQAGGMPGTAAGALAGATAAQRVAGTQVPLGGGPLPGPATFGAR